MNPYTLNIIFVGGCLVVATAHLIAKNYGQAWYWASAASITASVTWGIK